VAHFAHSWEERPEEQTLLLREQNLSYSVAEALKQGGDPRTGVELAPGMKIKSK
jgi:hypothetical protein